MKFQIANETIFLPIPRQLGSSALIKHISLWCSRDKLKSRFCDVTWTSFEDTEMCLHLYLRTHVTYEVEYPVPETGMVHSYHDVTNCCTLTFS